LIRGCGGRMPDRRILDRRRLQLNFQAAGLKVGNGTALANRRLRGPPGRVDGCAVDGDRLGMGQPPQSALCSCVVAMRLGEALGLNDDALRDVYYQALLRYIGCNAATYAMAALFGDELALRHDAGVMVIARFDENAGSCSANTRATAGRSVSSSEIGTTDPTDSMLAESKIAQHSKLAPKRLAYGMP
jgi:hypothetical protein